MGKNKHFHKIARLYKNIKQPIVHSKEIFQKKLKWQIILSFFCNIIFVMSKIDDTTKISFYSKYNKNRSIYLTILVLFLQYKVKGKMM